MDRRSYINSVARGGLAVILAAIAGHLFRRGQLETGSGCTGDYRCSNCGKMNGCRLPEAIRARQMMEKQHG